MTGSHKPAVLLLTVMMFVVGLIGSPSQAWASGKKPPAEFIAWVAPMAQQGEREFKVPASVAIAQAILESGWGGSRLTREANSFFGIKCHRKQSPHQNGCHEIETREYDAAGEPHLEMARFRSYATPADSFLDHGHFLRNTKRYRAAFKHSDNPERFIHEVHKAGYATDPNYAHMIISIIHKYDLSRFDLTPRGTRVLVPSVFGRLDRRAAVGSTQKFVVSVHGDPDGSITWQVSRDGGAWRDVRRASLKGAYRSSYEHTLSSADHGLRIRAVVSSSGGTASVEGRVQVTG